MMTSMRANELRQAAYYNPRANVMNRVPLLPVNYWADVRQSAMVNLFMLTAATTAAMWFAA